MENFRFLSCIICPNLTARISVKWLARKKRNLHPAGAFGLQTRSPQTCLTPKCATVLNLLAPGKTLCKLCRNFGYPGVSLLGLVRGQPPKPSFYLGVLRCHILQLSLKRCGRSQGTQIFYPRSPFHLKKVSKI